MTQNIIRVGDPTSHGGQVLASSATNHTVDGIAIALQGDPCSCPIRGHSGCTIAQGDPDHTINGVPVAYSGHLTTCGATLQSTLTNCSKT
jgi:uncharacterized Zn-binding protein involved in type VI secretion